MTLELRQSSPSCVKLPSLPLIKGAKGIYTGKYNDNYPSVQSAGKLTDMGDTVHQCLVSPEVAPPTDVIQRFRASVRQEAGLANVFYGRALDPETTRCKEMKHGVTQQDTYHASQLLNPQPLTRFQNTMLSQKEQIYQTSEQKPLGRRPLGVSGPTITSLPDRLVDNREFRYGSTTIIDGNAGDLVNPKKTRHQVYEDGEQARNLYRISHADFRVGEQRQRDYASNAFNRDASFGYPTDHDNEGSKTYESLKWISEVQAAKATPVVNKRVDEFREKTQPQIGKVHDPLKDTLNLPPEHTFGVLSKVDPCGAGDLIHERKPTNFTRGKDRDRGLVNAVRMQLKKANFTHFSDMMQGFKYFDKTGSGRISIHDLQRVLQDYHLPAEPEVVLQIMWFCESSDTDCTGYIDYTKFANFLNWKELLPSGIGIYDEDGNDVSPDHLVKQVDPAIGQNRTSSSMINAQVGKIDTSGYRTYGIPTIRSDVNAPVIRRIHDKQNYGDESNARNLIGPSLYSNYGINEYDFMVTRSREELRDFFRNIGVKMDCDTFHKIYLKAEDLHMNKEVSIESFRQILDKIQGAKVKQTLVLPSQRI